MGYVYQKFTKIVSKWPNNYGVKVLEYGHHLRDICKNMDIMGNVFPGTKEENLEKLDSLMRLLNNLYGHKYPCGKKIGACGIELKTLESNLAAEFAMHYKKLNKT